MWKWIFFKILKDTIMRIISGSMNTWGVLQPKLFENLSPYKFWKKSLSTIFLYLDWPQYLNQCSRITLDLSYCYRVVVMTNFCNDGFGKKKKMWKWISFKILEERRIPLWDLVCIWEVTNHPSLFIPLHFLK